MSKLLKIWHLADMQYEIRTSGAGGQRYDEFATVTDRTISDGHKIQPDIVVIAGDVYQFESANGDEQDMFSMLLRETLKINSVKRIIIIPGNHDVKQRHNVIIRSGLKTNVKDSISSVVNSINDSRISYYQRSGVYRDTYFDLSWAVWSQIDKWSAQDPKPAYSPWIDNEIPDGPFIELYHDPKRGAKGFDGQETVAHKDYKVSLDDFKANTIIAGDIHAPEIVWFGENNDKLFTYASSLVIRNFGEGNYHRNENILYKGNDLHGYNVIEYNQETDKAVSCQFVPVQNPVVRSTIYVDKQMVYTPEHVKLVLSKVDNGSVNLIRFTCSDNIKQFIENKQMIAETCHEAFQNCQVSFAYENEMIDMEIDEELFDDLSTAIDKDKIFELSKSYIERIINKTSTIAKEDKPVAIEYLTKILEIELSKIDLTAQTRKIDVLVAACNNFMGLAETEFTFTGKAMNVITGANGTGKSTAIHLMNWLFTDRISEHQSMRDKKYNNLMYFNTSSESDEVVGAAKFRVDGILHELEKKIERTWKANKKDTKDPKWMDNIKGVKVSHMLKIHKPEGIEEFEDQEAEVILKSLFDFDTLQKLTFINSQTIHKLINSSPEDIAQDFLKVMGLDISQALADGFEDLKHRELSTLTKHAMKVEDVIAEIESQTIAHEASIEKADKIAAEYEQTSESIQATQKVIDEIESTKTPVQSKISLQAQIDETSSKINSNETSIETAKFALDSLSTNTTDIDVSALSTTIIEKTNELSTLNSTVAAYANESSIADTALANLRTEAVELRQKISNEVSIEQNTLREKQSTLLAEAQELASTITNIEASKRAIVDDVKKSVQAEIDLKNSELSELTSKINNIGISMNNMNSKIALNGSYLKRCYDDIAKMEASKTSACITCSQLPSKESVIKIDENIQHEKTRALEHSDVIDQAKLDYAEYQNNLNDVAEEKSKVENQIVELRAKLHEVEKAVLVLPNYVDLDSQLVVANNRKVEIQTEYATINTEIQDLADTIDAKMQATSEFASITQRVIEQNNKKTEIEKKSIEVKAEIGNVNADIAYANGLLEDAKQKAEKQKAYNDEIIRLETEISSYKYQLEQFANIMKIIDRNDEIDLSIEPHRQELSRLKAEYLRLQEELRVADRLSSNIDSDIAEKKLILEDIKKYNLVEASMKLYKKIIGKDGLPQFVFAHLIPLINREFNAALSDVNFRLLFDVETLELRFFDIKSGVSRPMTFISGMERTASTLIITQIRRLLNRLAIFNFMFIDEISGTLNDGSGLDYEALNYKEITVEYVKRLSALVPIYIIDHVLDFGADAQYIEVQPSEIGSTYAYK